MAYQPPQITSAGLTIPTYQDILDDLIAQAKGVYGQDIYLDNDSPDYQQLSAISLKISDCMSSAQLAYNNRAPQTAVGTGLDSIIKMNGMKRKAASYSTCTITLTGTAGAVVNNGIVSINGNKWDLPPIITIGEGGTVDAAATCEALGANTALLTDAVSIVTPTAGWTSAAVSVAAVPGQPVEKDSQVKSRQAISVALPSLTRLEGTIGALAALSGVLRSKVYENPTDAIDSNGLPRHSITCVVEGGADADVAEVIRANRGIGCMTNGTTTINVTNPNTGVVIPISFYRPTYVPIFVTVNIHALSSYVSSMASVIQTAIANYLNSQQIGTSLTPSTLYGPALATTPDINNPAFVIRSIVAGSGAGSEDVVDIPILFNQVVQGSALNVAVNLVA